jgi:hypothetical protein
MKKPIVNALGLLGGALLLTAGVATAAPQEEQIVANVPFDFVVGTTPMPAGKYVVKTATDNPEVLLVESTNGHYAAFALTTPVVSRPSDQSSLVFEKRDNQYVLSRLMGEDGEGHALATKHSHNGTEVALTPMIP